MFKRQIMSAVKTAAKAGAVFYVMGLWAPTRRIRNMILNNSGTGV